MVGPKVADEISFIIIFRMVLCIAGPFHSVALRFVLVPCVSAIEEVVAHFAICIGTYVGLKVFEDVFPGGYWLGAESVVKVRVPTSTCAR